MAYEQYAVHAESATPLFLSLSKFQQSRALVLANELEPHYESVLTFGQATQQELKKFSATMLNQVQKNNNGLVRTVLQDLITHLEQIEPDALLPQESGIFKRLFARKKQPLQQIMTHYTKLGTRIDRLGIQLTHAQQDLLKDLQLLDQLYEHNESYFHDVNVYIAALEIKKQYVLENTRPTEDVFGQGERDWQMQLEWLDRRLHDLELSREIAIQFAPQIRVIQQTNQLLIDKIQTSLLTTIPLWQSQIAMLLSLSKQHRHLRDEERLLEAQQKMHDRNSATLRYANDENKQQIASLKDTQQKLLVALEETLTMERALEEKKQLKRYNG